jgi:hypothetical protein
MSQATLSELLRRPGEIAARCVQERDLRALTATSLISIATCSALFGATVGAQRGGLQIVYSGLKVPLASFVTLVACVPAYYAFAHVFGRSFSLRSVVALTLASLARASLVLVAAVPVLWWMIDSEVGYHRTAVWAAIAYALAGLAALGVMLRGLGRDHSAWLTALLFVGLFGLVGGQTAWVLRPYLGRPSQTDVPFMRAPDGVFAEQLWTSGRSSLGLYADGASP